MSLPYPIADDDARQDPARLDLFPRRRAPAGPVGTGEVFGHYTFMSLGDHLAEEFPATADDTLGIDQARITYPAE
jgi:hypothetical protein